MTSAGRSDAGSDSDARKRKDVFFILVLLWRRVWCEIMCAAVLWYTEWHAS